MGLDREFRILGPLEALEDGRQLDLGGLRQRAVLALLLLRSAETISAGRLVESGWGGGGAALGGLRERAVPALLLLRPAETISAERLIKDVWAGEPPDGAANTLQSYVSRLRRELGGERVRAPPGRPG